MNCQNVMGAGVAKALYTKFPEVKNRYHRYFDRLGDSIDFLGDVSTCYITDNKMVYNLHTQLNYGNDNKRYVNYAAIVRCFQQLKGNIPNQTLAIPKIGCGLAGGDWKFVEQLINDTVGDELEIWVYTLPEKT